jgi:hypothetical protein
MNEKNDRGWNLYERGDGQRVLQYRTAPGKWRETRVPREHRTERAAERYALTWIHEYRKNLGERPALPPEADEDRPTIRRLADRWLDLGDRNPKLSPATRKQHRTTLAHPCARVSRDRGRAD